MKERIKQALKEKGFKMKDLAILLNPDKPEKYAQHRLSLTLSGVRMPNLHEVRLISDFLDINLIELIELILQDDAPGNN